MLKSYKYRIFPTEQQQKLLTNIFGQVRFVYNLGLETKSLAYSGTKHNLSWIDLANQIKELKNTECDWLRQSPAQALQSALRNLDNAYTGFFKHKRGFPKYKSKYRKQSFQLPQGVHLTEDRIFIPKLKLVDIALSRPIKGTIKTVTISKTPTNKYFVSILTETGELIPKKRPIEEQTTVGLDLGIKDFCITSDGRKFENQDFLKSKLNKLRIEQRSLSRKVKGSNHYTKQKLVVALLYEHIRNKRQDHLHKTSTHLITDYDTICLEDLNVKGLTKRCKPKQDETGKYLYNGQKAKSGLNRNILDCGWTTFTSMLEYKADWYGKNISTIGRFDPSSKTCSDCGTIKHDLKLEYREWACETCGTIHDRDVNAAINIKNFGLRNQPSVTQSNGIPYACSVESFGFNRM
ncbi:MAG: IS200/IS605 family element transposase accessory protein TnpB [Bacteroidetes bacterium]|nr:IS200/IS605 family element transposase accessory protein TnpB [Bacteroidota bacterium]